MATLIEQIASIINGSNEKFVHKQGTGGLLNKINEYYNLNSKKNSVPIISLIGAHKPKTGDELVALIAAHTNQGALSTCKCACKSAGTLEDFGNKLYEKQMEMFIKFNKEELAFDLESCQIFIHCLFVTYSLQGKTVEDIAIKDINQYVKKSDVLNKSLRASKASDEMDFKYGVDLLISKNEDVTIAIQVKPVSYLDMKEGSPVVAVNNRKKESFENKYKVQCFYLYYERYESGQPVVFRNIHKLYEILNN